MRRRDARNRDFRRRTTGEALSDFFDHFNVGLPTECWPWRGILQNKGYGMVYFIGRMWLASRVTWCIFFGGIPTGMHVLHKCDNPQCVNPDHLFLGTHADNMRDKTAKERGGRNKLIASEVITIRERAKKGEDLRVIAADYGVTRNNISYIARRMTWAFLE